MKNFLYILAVVFLFIFFFVFADCKKSEDDFLYSKYEDKTEITDTDSDEKVDNTYGNNNFTVPRHKNLKLYPFKKFSYPSFLKRGKLALYINNPTVFDLPSKASRADVCKLLIKEINSSKNSIDFAVYGFDGQDEIINALINARKRGVEIRGVSDSNDTKTPTYEDNNKLKGQTNIVYDVSQKIMHNKFFIIDDTLVFTGSMNISKTGCGGYNSNSIIVVRDVNFAQAYKNEFNQMYAGKFKNEKQDFSTSLIDLGEDVKVKTAFSPVGNVYKKIIAPEINNAKKSIRLSVFVLTYNKMIDDLISAKKRGVDIKIVFDATSAKKFASKIELMRKEGIKAKVENFGGKNHEKTISIDDNTLILGSVNFSYSGFWKNDENIVLIKNKELASFYNGYFDKLYNSINDVYLKYYPNSEGYESGKSCYDKIDNDFDEKVDMDDSGCKIK